MILETSEKQTAVSGVKKTTERSFFTYCATYQIFKAVEYQVKTKGTSCSRGRKAVQQLEERKA